MFAKRQSRMEKYVVDSETVQANKTSRPESPAASLPNEWKYTPNLFGRSYSLSPPVPVPPGGRNTASASSSPRPPATAPAGRHASWLHKGRKPLMPWEAASRHPLGLVDEAFAFQNLQQSLAANVRLAAQRKMLPEPPAEWKARVSHDAEPKTWRPSQSGSASRAPLPSFGSAPARRVDYRSLPRQWQPQRSVTQANPGPPVSSSESKRPTGEQTYKSVYTSNTWSWRR
ncbi:synpo2 [Pungitius sinensis]